MENIICKATFLGVYPNLVGCKGEPMLVFLEEASGNGGPPKSSPDKKCVKQTAHCNLLLL